MFSSPHLGEIQWIAFTYAPRGWAFCEGQLLPINQNQALFSLLGNLYGGDGRVNFALPDLRGRVVVGADSSWPGMRGGAQSHTISHNEMPPHTHRYAVSDHRGTTADPGGAPGAFLASGETAYTAPAVANGTFHPSAVTNAGGSQPHTNMQPYLTLNAVIALEGIFPNQS